MGILVIGLVGIVLLHNFVSFPSNNQFWGGVRNSLHMPMFALVAIFFWLALSRLAPAPRALAVVAASTVFAVATELLQLLASTGTSSVQDVVYDSIAATIAAAILFTLTQRPAYPTWIRVLALTLGLVILTTLALWPLQKIVRSYQHQDLIFPALVDYQSANPLFLHDCTTVCTIESRFEPDSGARTKGLKIVFDQANWPGFNLHEMRYPPVHYKALELILLLSGNEPLTLHVKLNEQFKNRRWKETTVQLLPAAGWQQVLVPLAPLRMPISQGASVRLGLFTSAQKSPRTLLIREIRYAP